MKSIQFNSIHFHFRLASTSVSFIGHVRHFGCLDGVCFIVASIAVGQKHRYWFYHLFCSLFFPSLPFLSRPHFRYHFPFVNANAKERRKNTLAFIQSVKAIVVDGSVICSFLRFRFTAGLFIDFLCFNHLNSSHKRQPSWQAFACS